MNIQSINLPKEELPLLKLLRIWTSYVRGEKNAEIERTIEKLSILISLPERKSRLFSLIIERVCISFKIEEKKLISSDRRHPMPQARKLCFVLLDRNLKIPVRKIAAYFNIDHAHVIRALKEVQEMNPKISSNKEFFNHLTIITNDIEAINSTKK